MGLYSEFVASMVLVPAFVCVGIAWDYVKSKATGVEQEAGPSGQSLDAQLDGKASDVQTSPRRQMISKALLNKMLMFVFLICKSCILPIVLVVCRWSRCQAH